MPIRKRFPSRQRTRQRVTTATRLILLLSCSGVLIVPGCDNSDQSAKPDSGIAPDDHSVSAVRRDVEKPIEVEFTRANSSPLRFSDVTARTGIEFVHDSGVNEEKPFPAANGSGIAAFDYDVDGWVDLLFLTGRPFPLTNDPSMPGDQVYRNKGNWRFAKATGPAFLGPTGYSVGPAVGDFNWDGFPDVFINCYGANQLHINQGDGTFFEVSADAGVDDPSWGTSAAALDFDNDGDLDIYVCNYAEWSYQTNQFCGNREENVRIFCAPRSVKPVPDGLYENLGNGRFREVLESAGMARDPGRGQGVVVADLDADGLIDVYVGNDANTNFLFHNRGVGRFDDQSALSGTGSDYAGRLQAGMGVDAADVDRDGLVDIFVTNYEDEHNAFYKNLGINLFQDQSQSEGLAAPSMRWVGWGTSFTDFNLDGWSDLVVTNGHTDDNLRELARDADYQQPPLLFHNDHGRLIPVPPSGDYFGGRHPGRSLCVADLDRDRDWDLIIGHQDLPPALLRNDSVRPESGRFLTFKLIGLNAPRDGIGSLIEVVGVSPQLAVQLKSGGSYLASSPAEVIVCLPDAVESELEVRWPSGRIDRFAAPSRSGYYGILEGEELLSFPDLEFSFPDPE